MTLLRPIIAASIAAFAVAAAVPGQAAAASPACWKQVINDWFDGRIDRVYAIHCYRDAIKHLPEDVEVYSDAEREIRAAMLAAMRGEPAGGGSQTNPDSEQPGGSDGSSGAGGGGSGGGGGGGVLDEVLNVVGPRNADSIPLPLLVLGGIALLLLTAAAGSFVARRVQARRIPVSPSPDAPRQR